MAILASGEQFTDHKKRTCIEIRDLLIRLEKGCDASLPIQVLSRHSEWVYPALADIAKVILTTKEDTAYDYNYGRRLFASNQKYNQIDSYIIPLLKKDPFSRRAVCSLFEAATDSFLEKKEVPSLMTLVFHIRAQSLHTFAQIRSSDMVLGWPANIYQISVLAQYIARSLNLEVGSITTVSNSAHLYEDQKDVLVKLGQIPKKLKEDDARSTDNTKT
jgi:thymidylate synthase